MNTAIPAPRGHDALSPIRVLLAEDEAHLGNILEQYLTARGFDVTVVRNGRTALERLRADSFDVALLDVVMPEIDGLEVLRLIREDPLPPEILVITGNGTIETAMAALKLGAYDFLSKPYRMAEIDALIRRAWEKRMLIRDNAILRDRLQQAVPTPRFVTQYAPLMAVMSLIGRTAASTSPVLVQGDMGTGKRLMARVVHELSDRKHEPFVEIDGRDLTGDTAFPRLFGTEGRTGDAIQHAQIGVLEQAGRGTLSLQNIDTLPGTVQTALSETFASGRFTRIGGASSLLLTARLVTSTTRDLSRMVAQHEFREDLLHHISAIKVFLPPLRERLTDVTRLAMHFAQHFSGSAPVTFTNDALSALERYRWPGNVSELRNVIERAVLLATGGTIHAHDLAIGTGTDGIRSHGTTAGGAAGNATTDVTSTLLTLEAMERQHVQAVLEFTHWHQGRAAELLGISPKTLYRKIREFGFKRPPARS